MAAAPQIESLYEVKPGKLFVDGKWVDAVSGKTFETLNPATGKPITVVAEGDEADIDQAVRAARRAVEQGPYPKMSASDRGKLLWRIGELILKHGEELARLETLDNGKPISDSRTIDVPASAETFQYYAGWATKICGDTIPVTGNYFNYTLREPMGVVGQIIPWNFPLLMAAWKLAPAIACGNACVLKPAEQTPLTALRLGEICQEADMPPGVVNIVPGFGPTAGAALVKHPNVDKIAFTGEYITGQEIMRNAAGTLKKISLELGGKSPNIVFSDADIGQAVKGAHFGIFFNQGEVCCAGSRLFLEESLHDPFLEQLVSLTKKIKLGDPLQPDTTMGPLVSAEQHEKVLRYIDLGKSEGAKLILGGERGPGDGYFVEPTIFDRATNQMRIAREEIFGPVVSVIPFKQVDEVIAQANDTFYGLAGAVWTRDVRKAHYVAKKIKAGTIWVNCYNLTDVATPFGGYRMSGIGRELGKYALDLYTQVKSVWINLD
jgi:acyl-CoA reductase-like NAD-dependent aldehyde dehydrogenase